MFHQGGPAGRLDGLARRAGRGGAGALVPGRRRAVQIALRRIDRGTAELERLGRQLDMLSRRQPGCRALHAALGLEVIVYSSDGKRWPGTCPAGTGTAALGAVQGG